MNLRVFFPKNLQFDPPPSYNYAQKIFLDTKVKTYSLTKRDFKLDFQIHKLSMLVKNITVKTCRRKLLIRNKTNVRKYDNQHFV